MRSQTKRSLELADAAFKRKSGVKRATFETMLAVLKMRETLLRPSPRTIATTGMRLRLNSKTTFTRSGSGRTPPELTPTQQLNASSRMAATRSSTTMMVIDGDTNAADAVVVAMPEDAVTDGAFAQPLAPNPEDVTLTGSARGAHYTNTP